MLELKQAEPTSTTQLNETSQIKQELEVLKAAHIDSNNRMRRNNILFLGLDDCEKETWKESEEKVLQFCAKNFELQLSPNDIERSHRLGRYSANKKRPVIIKLANFKIKERILACGRKFQGTDFAIWEDFEAATRLARAKLIKFIRPKKCAFKLQLDKLLVGSKSYSYDPVSDTVIEICSQSTLSSSFSSPESAAPDGQWHAKTYLSPPPSRQSTLFSMTLNIAFTNVRSIIPKRDAFCSFIEDVSADIILLTETWLNEDINDSEIFPVNLNLTLYRRDRSNPRGGGILIAVKNCFSSSLIFHDGDLELTWVLVYNTNVKSVFGVCYRPPDHPTSFCSCLCS